VLYPSDLLAHEVSQKPRLLPVSAQDATPDIGHRFRPTFIAANEKYVWCSGSNARAMCPSELLGLLNQYSPCVVFLEIS
jgi:hypothetical protein